MFKSVLGSRRDFLRQTGALVIGGAFLTVFSPACSKFRDISTVKRKFDSMGTYVEFTILEKDKEKALGAIDAAMGIIRKIHYLMSVHDSLSEISEVNRKAGSENLKVDQEFIEVVQRSLDFSKETKGLFDITVLPLLQLWGFMNRGTPHHIPDEKSIEHILEGIGYDKVEVNPGEGTIGLTSSRASIDVGGIGKGYAVDRAVSILKEKGIRRAIVNAGGEMYLLGAPEGEAGWLIGIQEPMRNDKVVATLRLKDMAVATSGNYETFVEIDGHRYGHIFDPRMGMPSEQALSSTIIAGTCTEADALATSIFVMGAKKGVAFIEARPETECVAITSSAQNSKQYEYTCSCGLKDVCML